MINAAEWDRAYVALARGLWKASKADVEFTCHVFVHETTAHGDDRRYNGKKLTAKTTTWSPDDIYLYR